MVGWTSNPAKNRSAKRRGAEAALTKGNMQVRVVSFAALVAIVFVLLAVRLWYLQVLTGQDYSLSAEATRTREVEIPAPRGVIRDRDGEVLATNGPGLNVTVVPSSISREKVAKLAGILGADKGAVLASYDAATDPETGYKYEPMLVKENADQADVTYVSERTEEFPGLTVNDDYVRGYPQGETASHVLGYTGAVTEEELDAYPFELSEDSVVGKSGIELSYEEELSGTPGSEEYNVDALGRVVPEGSQLDAMGRFVDESGNVSDGVEPAQQLPDRTIDPVPGNDLMLTIDLDLQETAEAELDAAMKRAKSEGSEGRGGAVVAMDPRNGEILAMASEPDFDPQLFVGGISNAEEAKEYERLNSEKANSPFTNRALFGSYPGASTFKVFTGLAGFSYGVVDASTTVTDNGGCWRPKGVTVGCWQSWRQTYDGVDRSHGTQDYAQAIADSNDKFFYQVADWLWQRTGDENLLPKFYERFGFGSQTGVDLPGETAGRVPTEGWYESYQEQFVAASDRRPWGIADWVNMSIGQGDVLVSPIQMAQAYSAVQNNGTLVTPHVGMEIRDQSGRLLEDVSPEPEGSVDIGPVARGEMLEGLREVTGPTGTAAPAFVGSSLEVAGKSGTGEMEPHDPVNWFAGWAENMENPLVVVVMVEGGEHSEVTAAPAVRNILEEYHGVEKRTPESSPDGGTSPSGPVAGRPAERPVG